MRPRYGRSFLPNAILNLTLNIAGIIEMRHDGRVQRPNELAVLVNSIQNQYRDGEIPTELQYAIRAAGNLLKDAMMCSSQGMAVFSVAE